MMMDMEILKMPKGPRRRIKNWRSRQSLKSSSPFTIYLTCTDNSIAVAHENIMNKKRSAREQSHSLSFEDEDEDGEVKRKIEKYRIQKMIPSRSNIFL